MARRKKKHQKERVLEPMVCPGKPIKVPDKVKAITALSTCRKGKRLLPIIGTVRPTREFPEQLDSKR